MQGKSDDHTSGPYRQVSIYNYRFPHPLQVVSTPLQYSAAPQIDCDLPDHQALIKLQKLWNMPSTYNVYSVLLAALPLILLVSRPCHSSSAAPDLLREAQDLLPYLREVRRSVLPSESAGNNTSICFAQVLRACLTYQSRGQAKTLQHAGTCTAFQNFFTIFRRPASISGMRSYIISPP